VEKKRYLLGNHAVAFGLVEGGLVASFAYPGTPSSEITEKLVELAGEGRFYVEWSVNEKVAFETAYGVALSGHRAAAIMKHVGLNVAADSLMTAAYTGVVGGLVVVVADDPAVHSSQNEQDSRRYACFAKVPCFEPSSPQEALEMARFCFSFSEEFGLPVLLRLVTRLAHGKSDVQLGGQVQVSRIKAGFKKDPLRFVMVPANARKAGQGLNEKQQLLAQAMEKVPFNQFQKAPGDTLIIAAGLGWLYAQEVLARRQEAWPMVKVATYPVFENQLKEALKEVRRVLVIEEGEPVLEEMVERFSRKVNPGLDIHGKMDGCLPREGEFSVELIAQSLDRMAGKPPRVFSSSPSLPMRPPVLCPGCPHRASFQLLKKVFGQSAIFPGDIGCYTLGINMGTIDTCLCMGAGISTGAGLARMESDRPVVAIIGDSTFFHAGIPALINAVYNEANLVVAILDNRTTAMTGHQPHPGTGETALGRKSREVALEKICQAAGADTVVLDPYQVKESLSVLEEIRKGKGVRVVIFRRGCVLLEKKESRSEIVVAQENCRGCKICLKSGCPAIQWLEKTPVITQFCTGCGLCVAFCPHQALVKK